MILRKSILRSSLLSLNCYDGQPSNAHCRVWPASRDRTFTEHMLFQLSRKLRRWFDSSSVCDRWTNRCVSHKVPVVAVIAHPPSARLAQFRILRAAWRTSLRLMRRLCCTSSVVGRRTSISGDLGICSVRAAPQDTHVHLARAGALQVNASHWFELHDPSSGAIRPTPHSFVPLGVRLAGGPYFAIQGLCACL